MANRALRILYVSAEMAPYAKVGGLADVAGSLPNALRNLGHDVKAAIPFYRCIKEKYETKTLASNLRINIGDESHTVGLRQLAKGNPDLYFLESPHHFDRDGIYMYADDSRRFIAFSKALLGMLQRLDWRPDVIHCNDWQTSLIPAYLKTTLAGDPFYQNTASVFTIHNLAYQGQFSPEFMDLAGLPWEEYDWQKMEFYGQVNLLKTGIVYSDQVNTVSETYKKEMQTEDYGEGLEGVLTAYNDKLSGILNGIDNERFNPETDPDIFANYTSQNMAGKAENKKKLLQELGLPVPKSPMPLIGMIARLTDQKGLDLLADLPRDLWERDFQFVLLGEGDLKYHEYFKKLARARPDRVSATLHFDEKLAQKIYAGCDMFIMPSRFEPCGLGQMISMRYGTVPVGRATGGIKDSIIDFNPDKGTGNGFLFHTYKAASFNGVLKRALAAYRDEATWKKIQQNGMRCDFSWTASAKNYAALYRAALGI